MTDPSHSDAMLPGLEPAGQHATPLELAARRTLAAVDQAGLLGERHALTCQLILDLAQVVGTSSRHGKASAAALAAAQLREAIDSLPTDETEGGDDDPFDELAGELRCAAGLCDHQEHEPAQ